MQGLFRLLGLQRLLRRPEYLTYRVGLVTGLVSDCSGRFVDRVRCFLPVLLDYRGLLLGPSVQHLCLTRRAQLGLPVTCLERLPRAQCVDGDLLGAFDGIEDVGAYGIEVHGDRLAPLDLYLCLINQHHPSRGVLPALLPGGLQQRGRLLQTGSPLTQ